MPTLDDITGTYFDAKQKRKLKDGYYAKCKNCGEHTRLRGNSDYPYKYPPAYEKTKKLGVCKACSQELHDRIFFVRKGVIHYMIVRQEIRISQQLKTLAPDLYAKLNDFLKRQIEYSQRDQIRRIS